MNPWSIAVGIALTVCSVQAAQAQLGKTLAECKASYIDPKVGSVLEVDAPRFPNTYMFGSKGWYGVSMFITFTDDVATRIAFVFPKDRPIGTEFAFHLVQISTVGDVQWTSAPNDENGNPCWIANSETQYSACLANRILTVVSSRDPVATGHVAGSRQETINGQTVTVLPP